MLDFQSQTWHLLRKWAEEELRRARLKNDSVGLPPEETSAIRGEIRAFKRLLGLPQSAHRDANPPGPGLEE
jgi:hypothetical protein